METNYKELCVSPSVEKWEIEIRQIIDGQLENDIIPFGRADVYVYSIFEKSDDVAYNKELFNLALFKVLDNPELFSFSSLNHEEFNFYNNLFYLLRVNVSPSLSSKLLNFLKGLLTYINNSNCYNKEKCDILLLQCISLLDKIFPFSQYSKRNSELKDFSDYVNFLKVDLLIYDEKFTAIATFNLLKYGYSVKEIKSNLIDIIKPFSIFEYLMNMIINIGPIELFYSFINDLIENDILLFEKLLKESLNSDLNINIKDEVPVLEIVYNINPLYIPILNEFSYISLTKHLFKMDSEKRINDKINSITLNEHYTLISD